MESDDDDGSSFTRSWLLSLRSATEAARSASQYMLLLAVLGESFSGSVAVSDGLGRLEDDDEDEDEDELQSDLAKSAEGDRNAIPIPMPLLLLWAEEVTAEPILLSPIASGSAEEGSTAGEELDEACLIFCSACIEEERSARAEAMLRVLGERNCGSDDADGGATMGGLSKVPEVVARFDADWSWIVCERSASIDAILRLVGVALAIVADIDPMPKLFKALLLPTT